MYYRRKHFIALEGPAGSGKTQALESLGKFSSVLEVVPRPVLHPRAHETEMLPMMTDFHRVVQGLYNPRPVQVLDRFWMSSLIYQPQKGERPPMEAYYPDADKVAEDTRALMTLLFQTLLGVTYRDRALPRLPNYHLTLVVLLPEYALLERNREKSGAIYPFNARRELAYYRNYCKHFEGGRAFNLGREVTLSVKLRALALETEKDYLSFPDLIGDVILEAAEYDLRQELGLDK
jgi:hypothetical protein